MQDVKNKTIFVAALDWGLGHATRCVPVIRALIQNNNKIILGVTPLTKTIFEEEFPELQKVNLPAYNIRYSEVLPLWMKLILDWNRISKIINEEKKLLEEIISKYKINLVVSDSRFGLYSNKTYNVFITHQLFLKAPILSSVAQKVNKKYILNFDEVWVPDFEDVSNSLSSALSHGNHFHKNVKYIGPQSRLKKNNSIEIKYDYLFLISGPEPQNTIFKNLLVEKSKQYSDLKFALISNSDLKNDVKHITSFISPDAKVLSDIICSCQTIICRSGYSTLMDLHFLKQEKVILVPTQGQTEQEYLAELWKSNFNANVMIQNKVELMNL